MNEAQYGTCKGCNQPNDYYEWCHKCNSKRFQQNFKNWTSDNNDIDKFIQDTQLSAIDYREALEWIPHDRFYDIKYIAKGGFGKIYRANWIDGYIQSWDDMNKNWYRLHQNKIVVLKSLNNSKNVRSEFINEITSYYKIELVDERNFLIRLFGITQDPETKNYMMVLNYMEDGSLRNHLYMNKNYNGSWKDKICDLFYIAHGLDTIHKEGIIHQNLHVGNILKSKSSRDILITDIGLCKPADYNKVSEDTKNNVYGVLPYIAPEILSGQNYTKASDIYSFGIIHIMMCLDANPLNRPTVNELREILTQLEQDNNNLLISGLPSTSFSYEIHSEAIYTSRLLNFNNLPKPKNSDDYYHEQSDNLISKEFSESLTINSDDAEKQEKNKK